MPRYRKLPVVIEARQLDQFNALELAIWTGGTDNNVKFETLDDENDRWVGITIDTLEGTMLARPGDWIICGVNGEFYPCADDIFAKTYDPSPVED